MAASAPPAHPLAHAPPMSIDDVMADHLGRRRGLADALMRGERGPGAEGGEPLDRPREIASPERRERGEEMR